jgi:hypothetical protein
MHQPGYSREAKLLAVRAAVKHKFPTGDIEQMLCEIEKGYVRARQRKPNKDIRDNKDNKDNKDIRDNKILD